MLKYLMSQSRPLLFSQPKPPYQKGTWSSTSSSWLIKLALFSVTTTTHPHKHTEWDWSDLLLLNAVNFVDKKEKSNNSGGVFTLLTNPQQLSIQEEENL